VTKAKYNLLLTKNNIRIVSQSIKKYLTSDLLNKEYREINKTNKMFGHCHNASGCLYKIFGSDLVEMIRVEDGQFNNKKFYHWWIRDKKTNKIIDITSSQYKDKNKLQKLYKKGEPNVIQQWEYRMRVNKLLKLVEKDLGLDNIK